MWATLALERSASSRRSAEALDETTGWSAAGRSRRVGGGRAVRPREFRVSSSRRAFRNEVPQVERKGPRWRTRPTWVGHPAGAALESAPAASNRGPRQAPPRPCAGPKPRRHHGRDADAPAAADDEAPRHHPAGVSRSRSQDIPWSLCGVLLYVATLFTRRGRRPPPQRRGRTLCPMIGPVDHRAARTLRRQPPGHRRNHKSVTVGARNGAARYISAPVGPPR